MEPSDSSQPASLSTLSAPSLGSSIGTPHSTSASGCSVEYITLLDTRKDSELKPGMPQSSGSSSSSDAKITAETERDLAAPPQSSAISGKIIWSKLNSRIVDELWARNYILKRTSYNLFCFISTIYDIAASRQLRNIVTMETGGSNSSSESCKTPVAASNDVIITLDDDDDCDDCKVPLLSSENEGSSAEMIYFRNDLTTEGDEDDDKERSGD